MRPSTRTPAASRKKKTAAAKTASAKAASPRTPAARAASARKPIPDWDRLTFSFTETDVLYLSRGDTGGDPVWDRGEYLPFGPISLSPAAAFLSYGIGIFEGLKAQRAWDGRVLLFRHRDNALRFQRSAERLLMAPFPADRFVEAVEGVVARNLRFVPPADKGSFYVRPMEHAVESKLGLGPCSKFWVTIYGCPVGGYFASKEASREASRAAKGPEGVRLQVLEQGRCAAGGTGSAKSMGNYAGGIAIASRWKARGFDDVLYLDARHLQFLTETSGSNVFVKMKDGTVVTPPLDDQILPGVTRDSAIRVAREILELRVDERPIPIDEVIDQGEEVFCTGTAWTVQSVRELVHRDRTYAFPVSEVRRALLAEIRGIQTGEKKDPFGWVKAVEERG